MPQPLKIHSVLLERGKARFLITSLEWNLSHRKLFLLDEDTGDQYTLSALGWKVQHALALFLRTNPDLTMKDAAGSSIEFKLLGGKTYSVQILR